MAKPTKNANLERTARLLNLVPYLLAHQGIAVSELSAIFAVSETELLEDLNTLWMCGLPGYTPLELIDLSFDSGYVTIWNAETLQSPRSLSRDEALTLVLGLGYLKDEIEDSDRDLQLSLEGLIGKLTASFENAPLKKVHAGAATSALIRGAIEKAMLDRGVLTISYHSMARDVLTERVVHPLELRIDEGVEYLYAYCESSSGYRTFRLDRILSFTPSNSSVVPSFSDKPESQRKIRAEIEVHSRLRDAFERFHAPMEATSTAGFPTIFAEGFNSDWLVREIMSFGGELDLQLPTVERAKVLARSERTLMAYEVPLGPLVGHFLR